ncbi:CUGBP Elav-like family member 1-A [Acomys russatus]|uniref:CUGBP Elav-like family member 1-A n=1 Tax=Acomys russatus TaxID=60746 RepID=UPI0021E25E0D|nr:CUGBP Elav-like family member 1-A [Acomys russatus]
MNTSSLSLRKRNGRDKFPEGFRIDATKNEEDANKMFIGGLSEELNKQVLREYLSQFGEIIDFIIKIDKKTRLSRGFGFVLFKDSSTVDKVLRVKDHEVNGKKIECKRAKALHSQVSIKKVFLGGLNPQVSEEKIRAYFGTFGQIEAIELPLHSDTKERRAFGFIKYMEENSARMVLQTRYHFIDSSGCEVKTALPKQHPERKPSKRKTRAKVRTRNAVPAAGLESPGGGGGDSQLTANTDAQKANQNTHRAGLYTSRANSNVSMANASCFSNTPNTFQENPNAFVTNSRAFSASHDALRSNSNTVGISSYTLETNSNPFWESQYALGASPNAFGTSQNTLGTCPYALGVNQYALAAHLNAFGVSQYALGGNSNVFWTNQHFLGTYPNAFREDQYTSGTNPNAFQTDQFNLSTNSAAFRPNYYAFMANSYDTRTSYSAFRTSQYPLCANPDVFGESQYAVGTTQNVFGANDHRFRANGSFSGEAGSSGSTEGFNCVQMYSNFRNVYNTVPASHGSNDYYLYNYGTYHLGSASNYNVQINQSTLLGNGYPDIYSAF